MNQVPPPMSHPQGTARRKKYPGFCPRDTAWTAQQNAVGHTHTGVHPIASNK